MRIILVIVLSMNPAPWPPLTILGAVAAASLLLVSGCGSGGESKEAADKVGVVATTTQVGDLVRQVGGDRVSVRQILTPNSDPHDYEPRPSDAREIGNAKLVFRSGGELDEWMTGLIKASGGDATTETLIDSVQLRKGEHEEEGGGHAEADEGHSSEEGHAEGAETDPHWWQDPRNAVLATAKIRDALIEADPAGKAVYERNAKVYGRRLRKLDASVAACINRIPTAERKLVTSHDALGYYVDRYRLRQVGVVIPSLSTQAQPSGKDITRLVGEIRRQKVKAIFPESSLNPRLEAAVSRESGAKVGGALWADTLGPRGSGGENYIESIVSNTHEIALGVTGGKLDCAPTDR